MLTNRDARLGRRRRSQPANRTPRATHLLEHAANLHRSHAIQHLRPLTTGARLVPTISDVLEASILQCTPKDQGMKQSELNKFAPGSFLFFLAFTALVAIVSVLTGSFAGVQLRSLLTIIMILPASICAELWQCFLLTSTFYTLPGWAMTKSTLLKPSWR